MTDTDSPPTDDAPAKPGRDPLAILTPEELSTGSRQLKASVVKAITEGTEDYERAMACVLWLHRRRADPGAALGPVLRLPYQQVQDDLIAISVAEDDGDPTTPPPAPS